MRLSQKATIFMASAGLVTAGLAAASPASALPSAACDNRTNDSLSKVLECVTLDGVHGA